MMKVLVTSHHFIRMHILLVTSHRFIRMHILLVTSHRFIRMQILWVYGHLYSVTPSVRRQTLTSDFGLKINPGAKTVIRSKITKNTNMDPFLYLSYLTPLTLKALLHMI